MEHTSADYGLSKATEKVKILFRAPESLEPGFQKNEASSVYQFGLFLLYSTLGNLDFMSKSVDEIIQIASAGNHPAIPAHCLEGIATVIKACLNPDPGKRPSFAEIRDKLLIVQAAHQTKEAITNIQQEKDSLLSRIPKEIINNEMMKAIQAYGVFTLSDRSKSKAFDNNSSNIAAFK